MDIMQLLWGVITVLLVILWFSIRMWIASVRADIAEIKVELQKKASLDICQKIHAGVNTMLHKHAKTGTSGEVVEMQGGMI